jgi:hypothetical protein
VGFSYVKKLCVIAVVVVLTDEFFCMSSATIPCAFGIVKYLELLVIDDDSNINSKKKKKSIARCIKEKENLDLGFCFLYISIII